MDKKIILSTIYKNRFLLILCSVLIAGTFFGTYAAEKIPHETGENLFLLFAEEPEGFIRIFINRFCFPFAILLGIYLSGNSVLGIFSSPVCVFLNGMLFGFEKAVNYEFSGAENILKSVFFYFTATLYFLFFQIILAESSIEASIGITDIIKGKVKEKAQYNAKKHTVKFITFTFIFVIIATISAYIFILLKSFF